MKTMIGTLLALGGITSFALTLNAQEPQNFVVVVHVSNGVQSLSLEDVSRYFQKKATRWPNGQSVIPVDLDRDSAIREQFTERVHRRPISAIKAYWHRQIYSGRGVPPLEKPSDDEVLAFIGSNANAIGYVSAQTRLNDNVKVVAITDDNT